MRKEYLVVKYSLVMDEESARDILEYNYGDLSNSGDVEYDELLKTYDEDEVENFIDDNPSSYSFENGVLYITEIEVRVHTVNDNGEWLDLVETYQAEAWDDDLSEAKEYMSALTVDNDCVIYALELLKAFVERFGNSDRGCYDDNRNWFSAKAVTDFIKDFAEMNGMY